MNLKLLFAVFFIKDIRWCNLAKEFSLLQRLNSVHVFKEKYRVVFIVIHTNKTKKQILIF